MSLPFKANILLFITSAIWGFAFVAQVVGMEFLDPFYFNAIRFLIGSLFLIPFINKKKLTKKSFHKGITLGFILFIASAFQQFGIKFTSAGNAGLITGLYVIIIPIIAIMFGHKLKKYNILCSILAFLGLLFINKTEVFYVNKGDFLVLISAFFWAIHVLLIDLFIKDNSPNILALFQFIFCSFLNFIFAFFFENFNINMILNAYIPIIYGGLFSVGIAYTLQMIAQKNATPTHSAIILSSEGLFAVIGGLIFLNETLYITKIIGTILILSGIIISSSMNKKDVI